MYVCVWFVFVCVCVYVCMCVCVRVCVCVCEQTKERDVLVSYLIYIKEQKGHNPSLVNMEELKAVARVYTNHGLKNPATENVHFKPSYGTPVDLARMLPGQDVVK